MILFCLVFAMSLYASVYMCIVVTCWETADLLAFVCSICCEFVTFPLVSWVRCGTWLYRFLIFAPLLTFSNENTIYEGCSKTSETGIIFFKPAMSHAWILYKTKIEFLSIHSSESFYATWRSYYKYTTKQPYSEGTYLVHLSANTPNIYMAKFPYNLSCLGCRKFCYATASY